MSAEILTNFKGEALQVYQPEEGQPAHCIEYGTVADNLEDMLDLYEKDKAEFFLTPVTDHKIAEVCVRWNRSMKDLISCAEGFIRLIGVTEEEKKHALDIMDYASKDSVRRKDTMKRYVSYLLRKDDNSENNRLCARQLMLDCIRSVQAALNSQSIYIRYVREGKKFDNYFSEEDIKNARTAEEWRKHIPAGHHYRPAYIYPKTPVPPNQRVPKWPAAYDRVIEEPVERKVYDTELEEFVLPEGYVSEDGLIDDKSVIWHPETCEVDIGYVGGERTVWNYKKFLDPRGVWEPGSWAAEYQIRLYQQCEEDKAQNRLLQHAPYEDEIPPYDRKPTGNQK